MPPANTVNCPPESTLAPVNVPPLYTVTGVPLLTVTLVADMPEPTEVTALAAENTSCSPPAPSLCKARFVPMLVPAKMNVSDTPPPDTVT